MNNNAFTIETWIRNRRSTFVNGLQKGGKIDDETIEKLLDMAVWAPSHGLVQAWHFKVFAGNGVEVFFRKQQELYKEITPAEKFRQEKYDKYPDKKDSVSHVIAILMKRDPKRRFPKQEDLVSVACVTENIYLGMQAFGIGGYLSTGDLCYSQPMRDYLQLEAEDECIGFFILGLPDETKKKPERKRIPAPEKTEWIRN